MEKCSQIKGVISIFRWLGLDMVEERNGDLYSPFSPPQIFGKETAT